MSAGPHFGAVSGLGSSAATATRTGDDINSQGATAAIFFLDVTATPNNAETLTLSLEAKDPTSGKYVPLTAFTALTASVLGATPTAETYVYTIYPGGLETAAVAKHEVQALALPRVFRIKGTHSSTGSWTYSVSFYSFA